MAWRSALRRETFAAEFFRALGRATRMRILELLGGEDVRQTARAMFDNHEVGTPRLLRQPHQEMEGKHLRTA